MDFNIIIDLGDNVIVSKDEYADLQAARTRLDVIIDLLTAGKYLDKDAILTVAGGQPVKNEE